MAHTSWLLVAGNGAAKGAMGPPVSPRVTVQQRVDLFSRLVEPTLQCELKHKGTATGDGSYSAELIGYVEIVGKGA